MKVTSHQNLGLVEPVRKSLFTCRFSQHINLLANQALASYPLYVLGGAVRDPIVTAKYGIIVKTRDLDILVDDSQGKIDFRKSLRDIRNVQYSTRLGSPRWTPDEGLEIDIIPFSLATKLRTDSSLPVSLATTLQSCDFTTNAIAYGLRDNKVYSLGALEAIDKREVDLLHSEADRDYILMLRAVMLAKKLKFQIGQRMIDLIVSEYSPDKDSSINEYMMYKKTAPMFEEVIRTLRQIKNQFLSS